MGGEGAPGASGRGLLRPKGVSIPEILLDGNIPDQWEKRQGVDRGGGRSRCEETSGGGKDVRPTDKPGPAFPGPVLVRKVLQEKCRGKSEQV